MEETVSNLLQNQNTMEGFTVDPLNLMKAYKDKLLEEMWKQQDSLEGTSPVPTERSPGSPGVGSNKHKVDRDKTKPILERLLALEAENSALTMENDNQRKQYERCLDEVANQVVQALLTQKDLKEECVKLRTRVFDLEQQNRILTVLFQQRIKTSTNVISEEVLRNGKTGVSAGRWPSLLSLTCPRSSCSGSEASLSSACSEYSSGSHTWAEGRGYSKQSAISREKRMSAGSVSSNHSAPADQPDLSWKQGHILKGLKRLQMRSPAPKETSSLVSTSHFQDCMTSNEGIYSLGAKCGAQGVLSKLTLAKPFKPGAGVSTLVSDSDEADDESPLTRESCNRPIEEILLLEREPVSELRMAQVLKISADNHLQEEPVRLVNSSSNSLLANNDAFELENPPLGPEPGPTESPIHLGGLENTKQSAFTKWNSRESCNCRSEMVKQPQDTITDKEPQAGDTALTLPILNAATKTLSWASEARRRSVSMDRNPNRDPKCQGGFDAKDKYKTSESQQRKEKSKVCDSARKAFYLRSKSADGSQDQAKLHQPLHQKLINVNQRYKNHSNSLRQSGPGRKTNLNKASDPANGSEKVDEKGVDFACATSGTPEGIVQSSSSSPQKLVKVFKPSGLKDCPKSASKVPQPVSKLPSRNDFGVKGPNNSAGSPHKHRRPDQQSPLQGHEHLDPSPKEIKSPPPPSPPGRTTSLLVRPGYDSLPQVHTPVVPLQNSCGVRANTSSINAQSNHHSTVLQTQPQIPNKIEETQQMAPKIAVEVKRSPKWLPAKVHHPTTTSTSTQEPKATDSSLSQMDRTVAQVPHQENSFLSQQSNGEPQSLKHLPPATASLLCHGIVNNSQHSGTKAIKSLLPAGFKTNGKSTKLGCNVPVNVATNGMQTVDTFNQETYTRPMMHCVNAAVAKAKARRKLETRCSSLEEPALPPPDADNGVTLDWAFDEDGWLFKRSVSVSTRPPLHPIMGMNGAKARSQSFGARYMDRPNICRSDQIRTQIRTNSGSSLNSLGDVFRGSMSCSNSYHCPLNRSHINNIMIKEGLPIPSHPGSSSDRFGLSQQRINSLSHLQTESIHGDQERRSTISTIEEKVMMGIEENLQKSQEQGKATDTKQKSGSSLANWFGFRKSKPALNGKKGDTPKVKEDKKDLKLGSILVGKHVKSDKKKERRKSEGHRVDGFVDKRVSQDALLLCLSMASQGTPMNSNMQGQTNICEDTKVH
ncbi:hypothetical protein DPEC_G00042680 [Dallia pectoralis]|uniref:Uncharacterized protein n=1 Tax=Dallia pectoralis TaxID=75939 RepID=A0ACC2H8Z7_DALPE|nr:hypothetical protein DPEC_G00042680 [Dallia pectoralis]